MNRVESRIENRYNLPQISSRMFIQFVVKISHITMDLVVLPASDRITLCLGPQLCIIWILMRPKGVWMVSVDQDHAFPGQHLFQLGTRSGYLTVASRVPRASARIIYCVARLKGKQCSIIGPFLPMIVEKSF